MVETPLCHLVLDPQVPVGKKLPKIKTKLYLSQNGGVPSGCEFKTFSGNKDCLRYEAFCDDFGPMNMLSTINFVDLIERQLKKISSKENKALVLNVPKGQRSLTNAAYLLGAYIVLKLDRKPEDAWTCFKGLDPNLFEGFRDATYSQATFRLELIDCWRGLQRGKSKGWIGMPSEPASSMWGSVDKSEYAHYDSPLNADMHQVVPNKFIAFRGPKDFGAAKFVDNYSQGTREFSPQYYTEIFHALGVSTVVRLNEAHYDRAVFVDAGIEHFDLFFEDCSAPPPHVVAEFCRIADQAVGMIAVHCKAGLGRTGTLIAIYMMLRHGFTARESMAWLRIMRSGSVIGEQQSFLCNIELSLRNYMLTLHSPTVPRTGIDQHRREVDRRSPITTCDHEECSALPSGTLLDGRQTAAAVVISTAFTNNLELSCGAERSSSVSNAEELSLQVSDALDRRCASRINRVAA